MLISNLENVKKEIQAAREGERAAWIFKNGKLADDIIAIEALEVIDAFVENIVNVDEMPLETQKKQLILFVKMQKPAGTLITATVPLQMT